MTLVADDVIPFDDGCGPVEDLTPDEAHFADQDEGPQATAPVPRWLTRYVERGFDLVFWSRMPDPKNDWKGPRDGGWPTKTYALADYRDGMQVGVKLGTEVAPGRILLDADFDWAPGISHAARFLPDTRFAFGRKGKPLGHALYTTSAPIASYKYVDIDGTTIVERRGTKTDGSIGMQTMLPPSIHRKSGDVVTLAFDGEIAHDDRVVEGITHYAVACLLGRHWPKNGPDTNQHDLASYAAGFLIRRRVDREVVTTIVEVAATIGGDDNVPDRVRYAKDTIKRYQAGNAKASGGPKLAKELGQDVVALLNEWLDCKDEFVRVEGKIVKDSQENIRHAVTRLNVTLSYDEFGDRMLIRDKDGPPRHLEDGPSEELWLRIDREFHFRPSERFFGLVINSLARENAFHPVRDYLDALRWDGVLRIDNWLATYGGAVDTTTQSDADDTLTYLEAVSAIVLIAAVKRIYEPGTKYDEMLVLESTQGLNKSSALRALCPRPEWFSDDLPLNVGSKEIIERVLGKWIVEASDLSGKRKMEVEQLKALMSRQIDGPARMAYARKPIERPRHFIIIGTTNAAAYLNDSTGARRFWPVRVKKFDVAALTRDRDQLWAEALYRVKQGASIRLPESLWAAAGAEQEKRQELDPWEDTLRQVLADVDLTSGPRRVTTDALWNALGITTDRRDRRSAMRISETMQRLGFERNKVWDPDLQKTVVGYIEKAEGDG